MAQETPFIGSALNDGTGDTLFAAASSWNKNFTEVYADVSTLKAFSKEVANLLISVTISIPKEDPK